MGHLRRPLVLILLATTLPSAGCYSYRSAEIVRTPVPDSVQIRKGDTDLTLHDVELDGDHLTGWVRYENGDSAQIRVENVTRERDGLNTWKTTWLGIGILTVAAIVTFALSGGIGPLGPSLS